MNSARGNANANANASRENAGRENAGRENASRGNVLHGLVSKSIVQKFDDVEDVKSFAATTKANRNAANNTLRDAYGKKAREMNGYGVWVCEVDGVYKFLERHTGESERAVTIWMGETEPQKDRSRMDSQTDIVPEDASLRSISAMSLTELGNAIEHLDSIIDFQFPESVQYAQYLNKQIEAGMAHTRALADFGEGSTEESHAHSVDHDMRLVISDYYTETTKRALSVFQVKRLALELRDKFLLVQSVANGKNIYGGIVGGGGAKKYSNHVKTKHVSSKNKATCAELRISAKTCGLTGIARMTKAELVKSIASARRKN